jgi:hypothetical protein
MSSDKDWNSVLIPMIRKLAPTILAQEIVGVQPMTGVTIPPMMAPRYQITEQYNEVVPDGYLVIDVNKEVSHWIEEQPIRYWKHGELTNTPGFWDRYIISEQLFTWLKMRWQT